MSAIKGRAIKKALSGARSRSARERGKPIEPQHAVTRWGWYARSRLKPRAQPGRFIRDAGQLSHRATRGNRSENADRAIRLGAHWRQMRLLHKLGVTLANALRSVVTVAP